MSLGIFFFWLELFFRVKSIYDKHLFLNNSLLKYATKDNTLADGVDSSQAPEKDLIEKEKATLKKLLPLVEKFVHEKVDLQVSWIFLSIPLLSLVSSPVTVPFPFVLSSHHTYPAISLCSQPSFLCLLYFFLSNLPSKCLSLPFSGSFCPPNFKLSSTALNYTFLNFASFNLPTDPSNLPELVPGAPLYSNLVDSYPFLADNIFILWLLINFCIDFISCAGQCALCPSSVLSQS